MVAGHDWAGKDEEPQVGSLACSHGHWDREQNASVRSLGYHRYLSGPASARFTNNRDSQRCRAQRQAHDEPGLGVVGRFGPGFGDCGLARRINSLNARLGIGAPSGPGEYGNGAAFMVAGELDVAHVVSMDTNGVNEGNMMMDFKKFKNIVTHCETCIEGPFFL